MAWRQRHLWKLFWIPCCNDMSSSIRITLQRCKNILDLIYTRPHSLVAIELPPLMSIYWTELPLPVGPLVPIVTAQFLEGREVCLASYHPDELSDE